MTRHQRHLPAALADILNRTLQISHRHSHNSTSLRSNTEDTPQSTICKLSFLVEGRCKASTSFFLSHIEPLNVSVASNNPHTFVRMELQKWYCLLHYLHLAGQPYLASLKVCILLGSYVSIGTLLFKAIDSRVTPSECRWHRRMIYS